MRKLLLLLLIVISIVYGQRHRVTRCPNPVACFVNPCRLPRPPGCDPRAICVPNYCGGCNRNFYDPHTGKEVCLNEERDVATRGCPEVMCRMFCEYGFATGPDGCPICRCRDRPT